MKTKYFTIALSLFTVLAIAQKKEIRDAGKALENASYAEAKTLLQQAEPNLNSVNDRFKTDFYLYKGQAYLGTGENISYEDLMTAAEAYKQANEMGSEEANAGISQVTNALVRGAINDQNSQQYTQGAEKLFASYQLNKDTLNLYYAANFAAQAEDYDTALKYYEDLKDMGYKGVETQYYAVNKETGEEELMEKTQRDIMVKSGEYVNPEDRRTESKEAEIIKNIAQIYIQQGKDNEAILAIQEAKEKNPDDITLLQSEADIYYRMGNKDKYKEIMEGITEKDPNNPTIYYNLGVTSYEIGDHDTAIEYYKKALAIDPTLTDARLNIAAAILSKEATIVEEMNSLGMSKADTKKYDELAEDRKAIYREALPYLETVMKNDPTNKEAMRTTMNIYYQLGEDSKAEAIQEKLNQIQE